MKKKIVKLKAAELVLNPDLYPRHEVSAENRRHIREAMEAGVEMPPVVIDERTKEVVDGWHRTNAALDVDPEAEIRCEARTYANEAERFMDAMRLNAAHGLKLTGYDRAKCSVMAKRFGLDMEACALALNVRPEKLQKIFDRKTAVLKGENVPIKGTLRHLARKKITQKQAEGNDRAVGHNQVFLIRQLINLIEKDLLDMDNEKVIEELDRLRSLIDQVRAAA